MTLEYFDIPRLYDQTEQGMRFMTVLADAKKTEIFQHKAVQVLINQQWKYWKRLNNLIFIVPYIFQLVVFWAWSNFVIVEKVGQDANETANLIAVGLLCGVSLFKIIVELIQFIGSVGEMEHCWKFWTNAYATDPKNDLEVIGTGLILWNCYKSVTLSGSELAADIIFWKAQAAAALCIWARFIFYLRSIASMSYLVRMLVEVIRDMLAFAVVLIVSIVGMAEAFLSIKEIAKLEALEAAGAAPAAAELAVDAGTIDLTQDGVASYIDDENLLNYVQTLQETYLLTLGEFEFFAMEKDQQFMWLFFIIGTIFTLTIMLNLLIAVIGETFGRVTEEKIEFSYKEKAVQMKTLHRITKGCIRRDEKKQQLLFFAKRLDKGELDD